jgi:hypothetical protein
MIRRPLCLPALLVCVLPLHADTGNPAIDAGAHLANAIEALEHRSTHRIAEDEFLRLSRKPGTIVLDARSREKFAMLPVDGAINLPFPDIDVDSLARVLPDKDAVILIYCNNNFLGAPEAMPTKAPSASLNLSTFAALHGYGYRNVYELAPLVDVAETRLPLAGLHVKSSTNSD